MANFCNNADIFSQAYHCQGIADNFRKSGFIHGLLGYADGVGAMHLMVIQHTLVVLRQRITYSID